MARFRFPQEKQRLNGEVIKKKKRKKAEKTNLYGKEIEKISEDQYIYASLLIMEKMRKEFGKQYWNKAPDPPDSFEEFLLNKNRYKPYYEAYRKHKLEV